MITEETIARVKASLQREKAFLTLEVIEDLEKQIEKMKCCENCKYSEYSDGISIGCFRNCDGKTLWEFGE